MKRCKDTTDLIEWIASVDNTNTEAIDLILNIVSENAKLKRDNHKMEERIRHMECEKRAGFNV